MCHGARPARMRANVHFHHLPRWTAWCLVGALLLALAAPSAVRADPVTDATVRVTGATPEEPTKPATPPPSGSEKPKLQVAFAGGIALSVAFIDWARPTALRTRDGDLRFSVLRLGARASYGPLRLDFEYRIYPFYQFLRHAVVAYDFTEQLSVDIGVSRVPFGLLPFASNSWFFGLPYYAGLEDDADFGLRVHYQVSGWDLWLAFYKNTEGSYLGSSRDSARFSYDVVQASQEELAGSGIRAERNDRETNMGVARVAYNLKQGDFSMELGGSARVGMLQDLASDKSSVHWAFAPHARLTYRWFELTLEEIEYRFAPHVQQGDDRRLVVMGAFDYPYAVARRGHLLVTNLAFRHEVAWGPVELVSVYVDCGQLFKSARSFKTSRQLVVGAYLLAGPVHFSLDLGLGQHHPWIGPDYSAGLGAGGASSRWYRWVNANIGFAY
jgi:hypothetical protein